MPSQALAPVVAPLRPAGDGDDGAQTWKQLTRAQTCCWSNLITHIMCHYWAGAGNTNTAPTQYLPSVHTHLMLLYTSIRIFWNKPFIIIDECQNTAQSYSSRPDASTFNLHHQRPHEAGQMYGTCPYAHSTQIGFYTAPIHLSAVFMASFVNTSSFFCYASEIPMSAFGQLPKVLLLLPQLSVRSGAVIKCDSWYCVSPSCPRILLHPSLILVTVLNGTPSVMKKWWMFSENYWSDRHNWPFRRDNQIESLVPLTAGAHNSCFSWAIR